jgi:hypothetical protein
MLMLRLDTLFIAVVGRWRPVTGAEARGSLKLPVKLLASNSVWKLGRETVGTVT